VSKWDPRSKAAPSNALHATSPATGTYVPVSQFFSLPISFFLSIRVIYLTYVPNSARNIVLKNVTPTDDFSVDNPRVRITDAYGWNIEFLAEL